MKIDENIDLFGFDFQIKSAPSADERRDAMLRVFVKKLLAEMPASAHNAGTA